MARIYQKKSKFKQDSQREDLEHEHAVPEHQGLSHPAVPVAYSNNQTVAPSIQSNTVQKKESEKKLGPVDSPYQYHVPRQFAAVPPVQRNSLGGSKSQSTATTTPTVVNSSKVADSTQDAAAVCKVSDEHLQLQEKHLQIVQGLQKHVELINYGAEVLNFLGIPHSADMIQTQLFVQQEALLYGKLQTKEVIEPLDLDLQKYERIELILRGKIKEWDAVQAQIDKIDRAALEAARRIHNILLGDSPESSLADRAISIATSITAKSLGLFNLDALFGVLQSSFPFKAKRDAYFRQCFKMETYDFIRSKILTMNKGIPWSMAQAYLVAGKLRPADKFYIAIVGWGTDEGNVFFSMKEAYAQAGDKLESELEKEYNRELKGASDLPKGGYGNNIYWSAGLIDSEMNANTDDRIKAKAILSYGRVRPVDEIRMAVKKDKSKNDLKNALRKANIENLEVVLSENADKCLTEEAQRKMVNQKLLDDYKFSYGSDLMEDIRAVFTTSVSNYDGDEVQPSTYSTEVDEKGLAVAMNIAEGTETKFEQYLDEKSYNKKLSIATFFNMSVAEKKVVLDAFSKIKIPEALKLEHQQLVGIWEMGIVNEPIYDLIKANQLFDTASFDNFAKYNINEQQFKVLGTHLQSKKPISDIFTNTFEFLNNSFLKGSDLLWMYRHRGANIDDFFQHVVNSKDKNWQTNYIMNVLDAGERKYRAYYLKDVFYSALKDAQTKDNFLHIKGLLNDDPTVRIVAERKLLNKANSGLGAAITNIGSTAGLSAENEQRELEVDLEMALFNDGVIDKDEQANIEQGIADARETRGNFEEVRDTVVSVATTIANAIATTVAAALLPGAGGIIAQAVINGMTTAAVNWAMQGDRYSFEQGIKDMAMGGVSGAMGALGSAGVGLMEAGKGTFASMLKQSVVLHEIVDNSLGSLHEIAVDVASGETIGEAFKNHLKGIGTSMLLKRIINNPIEQGIAKIKGSGKGKQHSDQQEQSRDSDQQEPHGQEDQQESHEQNDQDRSSLDHGAGIGIASAAKVTFREKPLNDWVHDDFISFLQSPDSGLSWDSAVDVMMRTGGREAVIRLHKMRAKIQYELIALGAAPLDDASNDFKSDVDLNIEGADAGAKLLALEQKMAKEYGPNYKEMFKLEFFTEKSRLGQYRDLQRILPEASYENLVADITATQETFQLAKALRSATAESGQAERIEALIRGRADEVEIRALSQLSEVDMKIKRDKLHLEVDALRRMYDRPNLQLHEKTRLAEQISKKQAEINFYSKDAYISYGAMTKDPTSPLEVKGALMSQLQMIHDKIAAYKGTGDAAKGYEVYKYISRYTAALEAAGIPLSDRMQQFKELSLGISPAEMQNREMYKQYPVKTDRSVEQRAVVLNLFLDEAHAILGSTNWKTLTIANSQALGKALGTPTSPHESLASDSRDTRAENTTIANQNGLPAMSVGLEDTFGTLPYGAVVKSQTDTYVIYSDKGVDRIRFVAAASFTLKEANKGRTYSIDSLASLNSAGRPFVHEGRHRAIGAAKGGVIPVDSGGVTGKEGILDYIYSSNTYEDVGVSVLNLTIDQSMPDVSSVVAEAFYTDRHRGAQKPRLNIEKGKVERDLSDSDSYVVRENFLDQNTTGNPEARYFANFQLAPDGFIEADVKMTDGSGNRSSLRGAAEFGEAVKHFKKHPSIKLQGLRSTWGDGDNLAKFNEFFKKYKALGATDEAAQFLAVKNTSSSKWAEIAHFDGINITKAEVGPTGEFTLVEVTFSR